MATSTPCATSMSPTAGFLASPSQAADAYAEVVSEVEKQFAMMVIQARKNIRNKAVAVHPELQPHGFRVLIALAKEGPQNQGLLAEQTGSDKTVTSRTIKHLQCLNLISRSADPKDGRAHLVSLTEDAHTRLEGSLAQSRRTLHDKLTQWDLDEVERFAGLLAKLNESGF